MKNPKSLLIFLAILGIIVIILAIRNYGDQPNQSETEVEAIEASPVDAVMDLYRPWLNAIQDPETDPYTKELNTKEFLSKELSEKINATKEDFMIGISDPVLCTTVLPDGLRTKTILHQADKAQVLVMSREEIPRALAVVKLSGVNGSWQIDDISCDAGEEGPELGEFTFDKEGFLLKESVQPPLDPNKWYVVYEREGVLGYTAVLNTNESSECVDLDGNSITCGDGGFAEAMRVHVQGDMQEAGVDVIRVTEVE